MEWRGPHRSARPSHLTLLAADARAMVGARCARIIGFARSRSSALDGTPTRGTAGIALLERHTWQLSRSRACSIGCAPGRRRRRRRSASPAWGAPCTAGRSRRPAGPGPSSVTAARTTRPTCSSTPRTRARGEGRGPAALLRLPPLPGGDHLARPGAPRASHLRRLRRSGGAPPPADAGDRRDHARVGDHAPLRPNEALQLTRALWKRRCRAAIIGRPCS
jgi:hypothetical protein